MDYYLEIFLIPLAMAAGYAIPTFIRCRKQACGCKTLLAIKDAQINHLCDMLRDAERREKEFALQESSATGPAEKHLFDCDI